MFEETLDKLRHSVSTLWSSLEKEAMVLETLDGEVRATVHRLSERDPHLRQALDGAYGYAVFPSVGKATALLGCAFGKGEVFQGGGLVGYAAVAQLTLGVQLGGQTFSEIIVFKTKAAFDRFKAGAIEFAAGASAVLVKAGAAAAVDYSRGAAVFVHAEGGMTLEAALGVQKFFFRSAGMGRLRSAPGQAKPRPTPSRKRKAAGTKGGSKGKGRSKPPAARQKARKKAAARAHASRS